MIASSRWRREKKGEKVDVSFRDDSEDVARRIYQGFRISKGKGGGESALP